MTFLNLTYTFVMAAKIFFGEKMVKIFVKNIFGEKKVFRLSSKIQVSDFCQKCDIFFRFFLRSSAKSRSTAKRETVLSSLLNMLTILIILQKFIF